MRKKYILAILAVFVLTLPVMVNTAKIVPAVKAASSQSFSDDFGSDSGSWQLLGSAYRDPTNQCLVLTTDAGGQAGVAVFNAPIPSAFTANFRFKAADGWAGDGLTMFFYRQPYPSTVGNDYSGCNLGFSSNNVVTAGYAIEFDGWQNPPYDFQQTAGCPSNVSGDPSADHIALIQNYVGNHLAYVNDARVSDGNWHSVTITVEASAVTVSVDQQVVLQWSGTLDRTYSCFGFSGATGCANQWHEIDDFSITAQDLEKASLTTFCVGSESQSNFNVFRISGDLTDNGAGISNEPIMLQYSITGGDSWQDLTRIYTGADGSYQAMWLPTVTGSYMLKATYKGERNILGAQNIVNFSIQPSSDDQSVF